MKEYIVLLVDDDPDDLEIFMEAMNEIAPETKCVIASDGMEAMQILTGDNVYPDYIFLDINMPRMNGYEFLKAIKEVQQLKNIPVVVYSTSARPREMEQLMKLGAFGVHLKQYDYGSICKLLSKYLACMV